MPIICVIEFDNNPDGIYFAGQTVTGKVTFQTDELKRVNAITLKVTGFAHTHWSESKTSYTGHENYMKSVTDLMRSTDGSLIDIEPGTYSFNFANQLPIKCPSSFEGLIGHIRYTVTVSFVWPWKFDSTFTRNFTVTNVLDMRYEDPILYELATAEAYNTFGFGLWKADPLKIKVSIPQSGYVPGQSIPIDVLINNESDVAVEELKYSLLMHIRHFSQSSSTKSRNLHIKVIKLKGEGVLCYCSKHFKYELLIPATPPTCENVCSIIKITYELQVVAKVKGLHANPVIYIPIKIGNIPPSIVLQKQLPQLADDANCDSNSVDQKSEYHLVAETESLRNINDGSVEKAVEAFQEQNDFASMPPPSFDEAVQMTTISQIDERTNRTFSAAVHETSANLPTAIFEEAVHLTRINDIRNAYIPKYPVFSNVPSLIAPHAVEYNADLACEYGKEKVESALN